MLTQAPLFISTVFNDSAWQFTDYLTQQQAAVLYINSSLLPSTPGVAQAGKLLQTNLSNSITSLNSLGLTTINQIGQYINTSTTDSSSTITGSMITSGGLGVAKNIFCAGQTIVAGTSQITLNSSSNSAGRSTIAFTNDSSTFELGLRGTTNGTYNNEMYIYASGSYLYHMNILGWTYYLSTQDATSSTIGGAMTISGGIGIAKKLFAGGDSAFSSTTDATSSTAGGALTISGGTAIAKKLYVGSNCFLGTGSTGGVCVGTSTDTSRMISCLNSNLSIAGSNYITLGQGNSNNNQAELSFYYAGAGSANNKFQLGFYAGSRLVELAASGVMTINSGIASTTQSNGSLVIVGGLGLSGAINTGGAINAGTSASIGTTATIGSSANTGGTLSITGVGYHLAMYYSATINSTINTSSAGDIVLTSTNGGTSTYFTFANNGQVQLSGITARNGHKIDLGTNTSLNNIICLAQANNTSPSYMLGVNNSTLQYVSGSAHAWFANTSTTPAINGTENMRLSQQGSLILNNSGFHAYGSDITGLSSINAVGMHMQVASSVGTLLAYNYATSTYADMNIQSTIYYKASNGYIGIGTNSPTSILHVNGTAPQSTASGFGYLASSGAGSATGFTNRQFSIFCSGGIMCNSGEIDVLSDIRQKQKIKVINSDLAHRFIMDIQPIEYAYNANPDELHYGYSAQELVKHGYNTIVGYTGVDEPLPEQTIECTNGDILHLPSDTRLIVNMLNTIPLLHKALQKALSKIDELVQICGKQQMQINQLFKSTDESDISETDSETKAKPARRLRRI